MMKMKLRKVQRNIFHHQQWNCFNKTSGLVGQVVCKFSTFTNSDSALPCDFAPLYHVNMGGLIFYYTLNEINADRINIRDVA